MADNPARPARGSVLIALDKLTPGEALALDFRAGAALYSLIVARDDAGVYAYENVCPHAQSPLERFDGRVLIQERCFLVCATHGASFRMTDGACVGGPALGHALTPVAITVEDGVVRLV